MNVVNMEDIASKQKKAEKDHLLKTLEDFKTKIVNDEIVSYTICSIRSDDDIEILACVKDRLQAIGLIEASKTILFNSGTERE